MYKYLHNAIKRLNACHFKVQSSWTQPPIVYNATRCIHTSIIPNTNIYVAIKTSQLHRVSAPSHHWAAQLLCRQKSLYKQTDCLPFLHGRSLLTQFALIEQSFSHAVWSTANRRTIQHQTTTWRGWTRADVPGSSARVSIVRRGSPTDKASHLGQSGCGKGKIGMCCLTLAHNTSSKPSVNNFCPTT